MDTTLGEPPLALLEVLPPAREVDVGEWLDTAEIVDRMLGGVEQIAVLADERFGRRRHPQRKLGEAVRADQVPAEGERVVPVALEAAREAHDRVAPARAAEPNRRQWRWASVLRQRERALRRQQLPDERQRDHAQKHRNREAFRHATYR